MNDCWDYSVCHRLILGVLIKRNELSLLAWSTMVLQSSISKDYRFMSFKILKFSRFGVEPYVLLGF